MHKQKLVLDLLVPALTGEIGRIRSKQGFSELSALSSDFCLFPHYASLDTVFQPWTLDVGLWTASILPIMI